MKRPSDRYQKISEVLKDLELVFTHPDGDYVFEKPVMDDSPTIHRSKEEIKEIQSDMQATQEETKPEEQPAVSDRFLHRYPEAAEAGSNHGSGYHGFHHRGSACFYALSA